WLSVVTGTRAASMKRLSWITTMLLLANASLVLWGVHLWRNGQTRVHEPEHLAPQKWRQPASTALAHSTRAPMDLTAVRDGAVFYASRHFHVAPPPTQTLTP